MAAKRIREERLQPTSWKLWRWRRRTTTRYAYSAGEPSSSDRPALHLQKQSVLLVHAMPGEITEVNWMQADLVDVHKPTVELTRSSISIGTSPQIIFMEGTSIASLGRQAIIFGGYPEFAFPGDEPPATAAQVHILDPAAKTWKRAANMGRARGEPAYGVINGKLYVAGGFNGLDYVAYTEVYDPESDSWAELSSMPEADVSCQNFSVWQGKLWLRAAKLDADFAVVIWSFCPVTNVWTEAERWPMGVVLDTDRRWWCFELALARDEQDVYMAESVYHDAESELVMTVRKLNTRRLLWVPQTVYEDNCRSGCDCLSTKLHGLRDGIVIVDHVGKDEMDWKVRKMKSGLIRLSVPCPREWLTTVLGS